MARSTINPDPTCVQIEGIHPDGDGLTIILRTSREAVPCPACDQLADCVHSWYQRTLADLPWQGLAVRFLLKTRRWFCRNSACSRSIFTERLPDLVEVSARRTNRLAEVVEAVAFALGGEAGSRLLLTLGLTLSPDTLLNVIRSAVVTPHAPPRIVGIDDWAWRRGDRYGTIIVDLERHRVVDLLPDRDPATVIAWLQQQPQIDVIARDRGQGYIEAATVGAPQALQVADRWHLLVRRVTHYSIPARDGKGSEGGLWVNDLPQGESLRGQAPVAERRTQLKTLRLWSGKTRVLVGESFTARTLVSSDGMPDLPITTSQAGPPRLGGRA